ncbi:RDD family protein [Helicobacter sp. MIT 05-5293]|uniref:RDD family protein n=1 Tax=Helicobacter sp. MIT 05-5293 TaxID=1548149 RepID=UPI00051D6BC5|nr:RDD family protein [Helicobacter sp. MIT 05-5293]TLD80117.1 RDD family protein [Helicobacter sp. MIT 05-5293]
MKLDEKIQDLIDRENLKIADLNVRALAWFVDIFLLSLIFACIHTSVGNLSDEQGLIDYEALRAFVVSYIWQMCCLKVIYDSFFIWFYGASLGKIFFKMRVVSVDLVDKPCLKDCVLRSLGKLIGEALFFVTYIFAFGDTFRRALHDRLAKTLVIAS